jgi:uncharacterized protein YchJ
VNSVNGKLLILSIFGIFMTIFFQPALLAQTTGSAACQWSAPIAGYATFQGNLSSIMGKFGSLNAQIQVTGQQLDQTLGAVGTEISKSNEKVSTVVTELQRSLNRNLKKIMSSSAAAQVKAEAEYEMSSPQSIPAGAGRYTKEATQAMTLNKTMKKSRESFQETKKKYNESMKTPQDAKRLLRVRSDTSVDANTLFPAEGTIPQNRVANANKYILSLTNPLPDPDIPQNLKKTPQAAKYEATRKKLKTYTSLAQSTLNRIKAQHIPAVNVDQWASDKWSKMGGSGDPPGLSPNGMMSQSAYLDFEVMRRYANPSWNQNLMKKNGTALWRQFLNMQALRLKMVNRQRKMMKRLAAVESINFIRRVNDKLKPQLSRERSSTMQTVSQ